MHRTSLFALALLLLGGPGALAAQASAAGARATLEVSLAETTVGESAETFAGMTGLLAIDGRFAFGAGGALMLGSSTVDGSDLDLRLSYGGLVLQARVAGSSDRYLGLRTLVGAGNAKVRVSVAEPDATDNFGVVEPEIGGALRLAGPLQVGVGVAYRHVFGVEDLPNVAATDMTGFSVRARLSVHTR